MGLGCAKAVVQGLMHDIRDEEAIRGRQPVGCQLPVGPDVCTDSGRQVHVPDIQS